jgi:hypothetical protein
MIDKKQLDALSHQDAFIQLLDEVHDIRESLIRELHDVSSEKIQQISGRILQCDEFLMMAGYKSIENRRTL